MPTLYDITSDMRAIDQLLDECGGDVSDERVLQAIENWIAELDTNLRDKVEGYAAYITELLAKATARRAESRRLADLAKANENAAKRLKERLLWALEERGIDKVETPLYVVSVAKNGGKAPLDIQVPAEQLPMEYQKVEYSPAKDSIRNALEQGIEIDGCTLMERGTSLRIR